MRAQELFHHFIAQLESLYKRTEAIDITDWIFEVKDGLQKWQRRENPLLSNAQQTALTSALNELLQHKPVQYVLHEAWFYKRKFYVDPHVLIPRPETEQLVARIVEDSKIHNQADLSILDIGSGSGCIPITLKKELPRATVTSIDVSSEAINVARKNAMQLQAEVQWITLDFLDEKTWKQLGSYDIIVSNPPYISPDEKDGMAKHVVEQEPSLALFVPEDDPLIFYRKIAGFAQHHLNRNGKIYMEIHEDRGAATLEIFSQKGYECTLEEDWYGKERMVIAALTDVPPKQK